MFLFLELSFLIVVANVGEATPLCDRNSAISKIQDAPNSFLLEKFKQEKVGKLQIPARSLLFYFFNIIIYFLCVQVFAAQARAYDLELLPAFYKFLDVLMSCAPPLQIEPGWWFITTACILASPRNEAARLWRNR